ncbi:MAG: hypothetical protein KF884_10800 [Fimbriimonadaceae bacterium]|nr:hypothetical protein [Fimbriimonadaceae bacterium]QYK58035.1 MAG: hypothetical protein KF884_10800 [Fimbriimonadaceae bacterium]
MTHTYGLKITKADSKGGVRYQLGPAFKVSDDDPETYARSMIEANMHPLGAIIERVQGATIRETLGLEGGVILRFHARGASASYLLLHESGSLSAKTPT